MGIELDEAVGTCNGTVEGKTYFTCNPKVRPFKLPIQQLQKWLGPGGKVNVQGKPASGCHEYTKVLEDGRNYNTYKSIILHRLHIFLQMTFFLKSPESLARERNISP